MSPRAKLRVRIVQEWKEGDCHVHLAEDPSISEIGATPDEALGKLLSKHPGLDIEIKAIQK